MPCSSCHVHPGLKLKCHVCRMSSVKLSPTCPMIKLRQYEKVMLASVRWHDSWGSDWLELGDRKALTAPGFAPQAPVRYWPGETHVYGREMENGLAKQDASLQPRQHNLWNVSTGTKSVVHKSLAATTHVKCATQQRFKETNPTSSSCPRGDSRLLWLRLLLRTPQPEVARNGWFHGNPVLRTWGPCAFVKRKLVMCRQSNWPILTACLHWTQSCTAGSNISNTRAVPFCNIPRQMCGLVKKYDAGG